MHIHATSSPLSHPDAAPAIPPARLSLTDALASAAETRELRLAAGAIDEIADVFRRQFPGKKAVVIADPVTFRVAGARVQQQLEGTGLAEAAPFVFEDPDLHAESGFVDQLEQALRRHQAVPVAVGSGTINDLVKLAAHRTGRSYLCAATAASMDGYTAFGASITHRGAKQTFDCPAPQAVVADLEIIRNAPPAMTASGFADLQAKVTAGADWLVAHALRIEPVDPRAWSIVQGGLRDALAVPDKARSGDIAAIGALTEGLMLGGFAMQWSKSSRPASGAEHQFSHLWDMEHHTHQGAAPSHGFKVGIATLAIASLYEKLLEIPLDKIDVSRCVAGWPEWEALAADIREHFADDDFVATALEETAAKFVSREQLHEQLRRLTAVWPGLRDQLRAQLAPVAELRRRLEAVGAPSHPEEIGISAARLRRTFHRAYFIRRRFTVLDLAVRTQTLEPCLAALFAPGGTQSR